MRGLCARQDRGYPVMLRMDNGPEFISLAQTERSEQHAVKLEFIQLGGNDSNLLIVFYVQIMPDDFVMQLHRF